MDSVSIVTSLQQHNEDCKLYILGDTSYGRYYGKHWKIHYGVCV